MLDSRTDNRRNLSSGVSWKRSLWFAGQSLSLIVVLIAASLLFGQTGPSRPRVLGIAHVAIYVSDLDKARGFYEDFLGFGSPFSLKLPDGKDWISFVKVNDEQYLELFVGSPHMGGRLAHVAIYTDDVSRMRDYLLSRGVKGITAIRKGQTGDSLFSIPDPDGHLIEIVQYEPDSQTARTRGGFLPAARISNHIMHVGIQVSSAETAAKFYGDILGFQEIAKEGQAGQPLSGLEMRVPDGTDYFEITVDQAHPLNSPQRAQDHIGLTSLDVPRAAADLQARGHTYARPIAVEVVKNNRRQITLFDPDNARIDLMEPGSSSAISVSPSTVPRKH
jgi:catechol 2,3-dioxygenase-like lactoylglutathione lyase family enzyme